MEVINRTDGRPFAESDMLLLSMIASQSAILIDHAGLFKELQEKVSELTTLIEVSSLVNSTLDLNSLLSIVMELSTKVMKAEASSLLLLDESGKDLVFKITQGEKGEAIREVRIPVGKGIAGWVAEHRQPLLVPDVKLDPRFYSGIDEMTSFVTRSVMCVPLIAKGRLLGVVEVLNKTRGGPEFSEDDLRLFTALAGESAIAIDNAMLHRSQLEAERIEQDLRTAYEVQRSLLPKAYPEVPGLKVYARMIPARKIGGDYYDFLRLGDGHVGFVIADVAGKGLPSALLVNILRSILRGYLSRPDCPPSFVREIVSETNRRIYEDIEDPSKFITLFFALLDVARNRLRYVDAGHTLTILYRKSAGRCDFLKTEGMVLGVDPEIPYEEKEVELCRGDKLFMYTDGLIEAENSRAELFGVGRMVEIIEKNPHLSAEEIVGLIYQQVNSFSEGAPQKDDLTMVALEMVE
jgi:serine phosphatase RsbU (regulator of sigma subunit)